MLKQKISDKFSNIFSRDKKQRQEEHKKPQQQFFNQSYFECKLVYNPHKLTLIKVIANILVGPDAGTPMMVNCKWLIKKNKQYSQIQGVTSSCYQPCIQDVGILVQITPIIEGKTYSGATIVKQTGPLQLGSALQTLFTQTKSKLYYQKQSIQFSMKIQAVFGKQTEYSNLQYPQDGKFVIRKQQDSNFQIQISTNQFKTYFWIIKEYPTLQFIRKSYNSVVISFTQYQSMRLAFKEGTDRQILGLLLRTLTANSTLDWQSKDNIEQKQMSHQKISKQTSIELEKSQQLEETPKKQQKLGSENNLSSGKIFSDKKQLAQQQLEVIQSTPVKQVLSCQNLSFKSTPVKQQLKSQSNNTPPLNGSMVELELKMGEMNTQLNKIKKQYKDLMKNYNIQKQNKCKLQHQIKKINDKLSQFDKIQKQKAELVTASQKLKEDNRFYRNEVSLLNKNIKKLQSQLSSTLKQKQILEKKLKSQKNQIEIKKPNDSRMQDILKNQSENWRKLNNQLIEQNEQLKLQIQKLQNNLTTVNKKLQAWHQQKLVSNQQYIKNQSSILLDNSNSIQLAKKNKIINDLQFKITNLQMLLKHRSGERGNQSLTLHKIINNLTQDITEKSQQLEQTKKINKQLMQKIQMLTKNK